MNLLKTSILSIYLSTSNLICLKTLNLTKTTPSFSAERLFLTVSKIKTKDKYLHEFKKEKLFQIEKKINDVSTTVGKKNFGTSYTY